MNNQAIIQNSINYIEENLKSDILVEELSEMAGYSTFHFYRIFYAIVGMPIMQYITRRRLLNAIYEISIGNKMIDIAICYGFNTHAGFFKAFRREFNCSPSEFLKKHKVNKPYKINLKQEVYFMITHKKINKILFNWGLENEKIRDIYYEDTDNKSENAYYVGEEYVIKITMNLGKLKNNIQITNMLSSAGFQAATPILTKNGEEYINDGELYFSLTKRLKGKQLKSSDLYGSVDYVEKARYIGEIIGKLHEVL
ncbi:MAG: helix-turn-helix domain-containing protein, partial [Bacteroidales bacterium]